MATAKGRGLSQKEAQQSRDEHGSNIIPEKKGGSWLIILLRQLASPLVYLLLFAALVSLISREYLDLALIGLVILFNSSLGFYQEFRAQQTLAALKKMLQPKAVVIREGKRQTVPTAEVVVGDLVELAMGDKVPAHGEVVTATSLLINEALITGEEEPVEKDSSKQNYVYMGTTVTFGKGLLLVKAVGSATEMGKIGQSLTEIKEEDTPLQRKLKAFSRSLAIVALIICLAIFLIGLGRHENLWGDLRLAVVLAVAAIPEGLPIAVTVSLSLGVKHILNQKGLVKKLISVETLGSASVICTDKTGTLTEGKMGITKFVATNKKEMLMAMTLANQQKDSFEVCLWEYVKKAGLFDPATIQQVSPISFEDPFNSTKKYSLITAQIGGKEQGFILGAPEKVIEFCSLSDEEKSRLTEKIKLWASEGLKVVAGADKLTGNLKETKKYRWLGLAGITDPIRQEANDTVLACQKAGIKIKIITGDYLATAISVAKQLGLKTAPENVMDSEELESTSPKVLKSVIGAVEVFARVTPTQKLKIVEALQANGEVVAMTGDGVNDAPALKKADIAVVVEEAADVAKEVADLILLDSNLQTIYNAVVEGRVILANIKKMVSYVLASSFAQIILIFLAMVIGLPTPLTVATILWINMVCDGPPDIVLSFEPKDSHIMSLSPRTIQKENIIDARVIFTILTMSGIVGLAALAVYNRMLFLDEPLASARGVAFAIIALSSLFYIFSFKNLRQPIFRMENFFANKALLLAVLYGLILVIVPLYYPPLGNFLGISWFGAKEWLVVISVATVAIIWAEAMKWFARHQPKEI